MGIKMNRLFNMDNGIFRVLGKLVDCVWLSMLFLITCIPIFTIGASLTSLYYTVQKVLKNDRGYVSTEYFQAFKNNFKQATIIWLVLLAVGLLLAGDIRILNAMGEAGNKWGKASIFFRIMMLFEIMWGVYIFSYVARFENTIKNIIKNAGFMAILNLPKTLLLFVITLAFGLLVYIVPISIILVPALYCWIMNPILESVFRKYMSEEDLENEEDLNREYKN